MPLIKSTLAPEFLDVVTTTLFTPLPSAEAGAKSRPSVPVPAIAGGVVAGAILAIAVTLTWVWWGKTIKRDGRKRQEEMEKQRKTRYNTIRNSRISGPKNHSYRPLLKRQHDEKRVKFAGDEKAPASMPPTENIDPERAKHMLFDNPHTPPPRPAWTIDQRLRRTGSVIWPIPRNPLKKMSQNSIRGSNGEASSSNQAGQGQGSRDIESSIPRKSSNISTASQRSNASGESHRGRAPPNLILAALGNLGNRSTMHSGDRQSTSSLWSYLFRAMPGARNSQYSADNTYQPPENQAGFPIGTAL